MTPLALIPGLLVSLGLTVGSPSSAHAKTSSRRTSPYQSGGVYLDKNKATLLATCSAAWRSPESGKSLGELSQDLEDLYFAGASDGVKRLAYKRLELDFQKCASQAIQRQLNGTNANRLATVARDEETARAFEYWDCQTKASRSGKHCGGGRCGQDVEATSECALAKLRWFQAYLIQKDLKLATMGAGDPSQAAAHFNGSQSANIIDTMITVRRLQMEANTNVATGGRPAIGPPSTGGNNTPREAAVDR